MIKKWEDRYNEACLYPPVTGVICKEVMSLAKDDEIAELRAHIAALEAQPHSATLHDNGCWTWNGEPPYESRFAGWRMKVYLAAGASEIKPTEHKFHADRYRWLRRQAMSLSLSNHTIAMLLKDQAELNAAMKETP